MRRELGLQLDTKEESESEAKVFRELKVDRKEITREPLLEGKWA